MDAKVLGFLRVANAALAVTTESGYGRIIGVSGQNAFVTGNVTGAVRNAALIITAKNLADCRRRHGCHGQHREARRCPRGRRCREQGERSGPPTLLL